MLRRRLSESVTHSQRNVGLGLGGLWHIDAKHPILRIVPDILHSRFNRIAFPNIFYLK